MSEKPLRAQTILEENDENKRLLCFDDKCDKYDYLAAVGCGVIGGLIDIFMVGAPGSSDLCEWTDAQIDKAVMSFAKINGWAPVANQSNNVLSAIGYLEKRFSVNYDQRYDGDVGNLFHMSTKNHHMMSLAHSSDIIGLFFSILNQFTSTASFIADGQVITIKTENFELHGKTFIAKLFCGVANWFGHIMSDIAGSSGSSNRGIGIAMPFYELFRFCDFGKFSAGKYKQDLATIATRAFQEGYDFRFGLAQAIPVIITDLSIRLIWAFRRYFLYGKPLRECIPTSKYANLRVMLLFGNGTLCLIDGIDAGIRSKGDTLLFFTRMNLIAWFRFVTLVLKEVCIRTGIVGALNADLDAYKRINEALVAYMRELEAIDLQLFKQETENYNALINSLSSVASERELNIMLINGFKALDINIPWGEDFDGFMNDKNEVLRIE